MEYSPSMTRHPTPTEHLSAYHQNSGLLFQFVLEELLLSIPVVDQIHLTFTALENALMQRTDPDEVEGYLANLLVNIAELTGSALVHNQIYPWTPSKGSLGKLKHYTQLLAPGDQEEPFHYPATLLSVAISKAYHSAIQAREIVWQLRQKPITLSEASTLFSLLTRLAVKVQEASDLLPTLVAHFREDENVLYYLLRSREKFEAVYKRPLVKELAKQIFKRGITEMGDFLVERYQERGFDQVAASIPRQIA